MVVTELIDVSHGLMMMVLLLSMMHINSPLYLLPMYAQCTEVNLLEFHCLLFLKCM